MDRATERIGKALRQDIIVDRVRNCMGTSFTVGTEEACLGQNMAGPVAIPNTLASDEVDLMNAMAAAADRIIRILLRHCSSPSVSLEHHTHHSHASVPHSETQTSASWRPHEYASSSHRYSSTWPPPSYKPDPISPSSASPSTSSASVDQVRAPSASALGSAASML